MPEPSLDSQALAPIAQRLEAFQKRIAAALSHIDLAAVEKGVARFQEEAKRIGEAGWTIPLWATPSEVSDLLRQASNRDIDAVFLDYYESEGGANYAQLKRELQARPSLERWRPLVEQSFTAFEAQLYLVVVPAMITVVEGAIAAAGGPDAWKRKDPKQTVTKVKTRAGERSITRAIWTSIESFAFHLFKGHSFSAKRPPQMNPQWILHGRDEPSWGKSDCLRLFQAVETICA